MAKQNRGRSFFFFVALGFLLSGSVYEWPTLKLVLLHIDSRMAYTTIVIIALCGYGYGQCVGFFLDVNAPLRFAAVVPLGARAARSRGCTPEIILA